jgi:hypothetical protein
MKVKKSISVREAIVGVSSIVFEIVDLNKNFN